MYLQSAMTIFEFSKTVLNWLVELMCTVFDIVEESGNMKSN